MIRQIFREMWTWTVKAVGQSKCRLADGTRVLCWREDGFVAGAMVQLANSALAAGLMFLIRRIWQEMCRWTQMVVEYCN